MAAGANEIILRTSKDWDDWYEGVQMKAMASNFQKYIDLDAPRIDPPMEPEPYQPNTADLRLEVLHVQYYLYKQRMETYKTYMKGVKEIYDHIFATVDLRLCRALTKTPDPRLTLEELKEIIAPTK
ncbi:hypothetical protein AJ78_00182 [Emergomyces pasteurianus Ep9510]|uniref:Uncharacterized protein n=1 Tax=Emergomyces pasteurianus Ep9510 TaxID=1447872 RepID=A0A1J9QUE2_9EURO|nr:hypothetical protein AJ78_00182 [Emergomyces pasteurianus Ep9510]